jgi:EmrB/QacA subfamily drug resistance transporter
VTTQAKPTHVRITFVVLAVATAAYALLQSLLSPVLPLLETSLHTNQDTVTWVLTAYLLSASVATPILGRVGDMLGKERVLVVVLAVLAAGSVLAALATSITVMIIARAVQGIGGAVIPLAFGIVRDEFPRGKVAGAVGALAALLAAGGGLGLVLAGPIVNVLDYHWLFWIPGGVVAAAAVATHLFIPESAQRSPGTVNWLAAFLLSGWLVALLVAVSEAPSWGWVSAKTVSLLVAGVVLAMSWGAVELRARSPLIDMRMMRIPAVWTTNLVAFLFGIGMYTIFAFLPEFVQTPSSAGYGFGASITESGLIVLPMAAMMFVFGLWSGPLAARIGGKAVMIIGSVATIPGFLILAFAHHQVWEVVVASALLGVGFGLAFSAMSSIIVDAVPSDQTGVASGMNANIRTIGGSIGAAVGASIVTAGVAPGALAKDSGYTLAFAMLAGASLLAVIAGLRVPSTLGRAAQRDAHQREQASMAHAELAMVAAGTVVGDEAE